MGIDDDKLSFVAIRTERPRLEKLVHSALTAENPNQRDVGVRWVYAAVTRSPRGVSEGVARVRKNIRGSAGEESTSCRGSTAGLNSGPA